MEKKIIQNGNCFKQFENNLRPTRLIARLDIKNNYVIKSVKLEGLKKVGDPRLLAKKYYLEGIDEIILLILSQLYVEGIIFSK